MRDQRGVGERADADLLRARRRPRGAGRDPTAARCSRGLVARLPGNVHVLLGSRTFPELGVARRAVQGEAVVLREEDLRFDDDEVVAFAATRGCRRGAARAGGRVGRRWPSCSRGSPG